MKNAYGSDPYICSFLEMITLNASLLWNQESNGVLRKRHQKSRIQWFSKKSMMVAVCFYKCQITNLVAKYTEIAI